MIAWGLIIFSASCYVAAIVICVYGLYVTRNDLDFLKKSDKEG